MICGYMNSQLLKWSILILLTIKGISMVIGLQCRDPLVISILLKDRNRN